jgi:methylenetetrahydrofolate reductase (NADPH)
VDLAERIVEFVGGASMEVTSHDRETRQELIGRLAEGTTVYVAHTPNSTVADVADVACEVESEGFRACPHIVARRIRNERELENALARMQKSGIKRALLVAGDQTPPLGTFASSLDLLESGLLAEHGFCMLGVAGYPEGHQHIADAVLRDALAEKQRYADRSGADLYVVTQFSFDAAAIVDWVRQLDGHGIRLPVHAGIMGPATIGTLIRYARLCGIGKSLRALTNRVAEPGLLRGLTTSAEEILVHIVREGQGEHAGRIVQPHFFSFGGVARTARWLQALRNGDFDVDPRAGRLAVHTAA